MKQLKRQTNNKVVELNGQENRSIQKTIMGNDE